MAVQKYIEHHLQSGHADLITSRAGFVVCEQHSFLGASPDAYVFDPGLAEKMLIQIPPQDASKQTDFCCKLSTRCDATAVVELILIMLGSTSHDSEKMV